MIRQFNSKDPAFVLETEKSSYIFHILPTGQPEHIYYGPRIDIGGPEDLNALMEKHVFPPGNTIVYDQEHKSYTLEDVCLEFSALGKGDQREPFLEISFPDGSRSPDFTYLSAEIRSDALDLGDLPSAYSAEEDTEHLIVRFRESLGSLILEIHYALFGEAICRHAVLINEGSETVELERLMSLQLDLPVSGFAVTGFYGAWIREMQRKSVLLPTGKLVLESRSGNSSSYVNPFFILHESGASEKNGECIGFNLIYSGNHYEAVEVSPYGKTRVVSGINPMGFRYRLNPGGRFITPQAMMVRTDHGFGGISEETHFFVREHVIRGRWKNKLRPVLLNSWEACYFNISERRLISLAKEAKKLGVELFVMDDGWFGERNDDSSSLGDWEANRKKLPGGLTRLAKKLHSLGLDFGIWVEPEMVNTESALYKQHPNWAMAVPGRLHSEGRNQRILDLVNPEVQEHLIAALSALLAGGDIQYVKWDYNRVFSDVYSPSLPPESQGETAHRYILGLYRIMRTLTERFPDILFEGCASGGNRFDLGILSFFPQIWGSDNSDALCRTRIQEGYSFGYPLNTVSAHVSASPNHQTLRDTPLDSRFHVASFGVLGYEYDLRDLSSRQRREIAEQIALYKQWREVLQFGRFYRGRTGNLHEWTCVSPDKKRAVGFLFQELSEPGHPNEVYYPQGLDPDRRYRFYNIEQKVDVRRFGSLINNIAPFHIKTGSLIHRTIDRFIQQPGETENYTAFGSLLMSGIQLKPAFAGTGYNDQVRFWVDYSSRIYFMEAVDE
jgi:alpha-galactosidase